MDCDSVVKERIEALKAFHAIGSPVSLSKSELHAQLLDQLCPGKTLGEKEAENIICNYIYVVDMIRNDLGNIDAQITALKSLEQTVPKDDDYEHKKIRYFSKITNKAKDEIITFLSKRIIDFCLDSKAYKFSDREDDGLTRLFLDSRYDYAFFNRYYDYNYDFSTEAKFRFIPGVTISNMQEVISEHIAKKKSNPDEFADSIDSIVSDNNGIQYIMDIIKGHYYLAKRTEIFAALVELYDKKNYVSFISLAVTQLEGVFYDCITIMNKKEMGSRAGTLLEKAGKVFSNNLKIKQAIYPHFAFSVPRLRNEIAHNGIASTNDPFHLCNEIILDLLCIVRWACHLSDDKYIAIRMTYDKLMEKKCVPDNVENESQIVLTELLSCYQICDREFLNVLSHPEEYEAELQFYDSLLPGQNGDTIRAVILRVANVIKNESFWMRILEIAQGVSERKSGVPYDFIDFAVALKNSFIPVLSKDSPEKISCQEVAKLLKAFEG